MKTLKKLPFLVFTILFIFGCETTPKQITQKADYEKYLTLKDNKSVTFAQNEIDFWQKKFQWPRLFFKPTNQLIYFFISQMRYL